MGTTQSALVFFFGMFWGSVLRAVAPFELFDTRMLFRKGQGERGSRRLAIGLIIVDVIPVLGLCLLLTLPLMNAKGVTGVAVAAILAMSVFSIHRLVHAFVLTRPFFGYFYSLEETEALRTRNKTVDSFTEHFVPALVYLLMPPAIAWLVARWL